MNQTYKFNGKTYTRNGRPAGFNVGDVLLFPSGVIREVVYVSPDGASCATQTESGTLAAYNSISSLMEVLKEVKQGTFKVVYADGGVVGPFNTLRVPDFTGANHPDVVGFLYKAPGESVRLIPRPTDANQPF